MYPRSIMALSACLIGTVAAAAPAVAEPRRPGERDRSPLLPRGYRFDKGAGNSEKLARLLRKAKRRG